MLTQVTEFGVHAVGLGERRPDRPRAVAGRVADLLAGEVLDRLDSRALQPVQALRRVGVDVEDADRVGALAAQRQRVRHVGQADRVGAGGDLLHRHRRALAGLEVEVDAGVLVPAHLLGVVVRRVVAARHPVEDEVELGLGERRRGGEAGSGDGGSEGDATERVHGVSWAKGARCLRASRRGQSSNRFCDAEGHRPREVGHLSSARTARRQTRCPRSMPAGHEP